MVNEEEQIFECLINHLKTAFQSGETVSEPISDIYGRNQKNKTEDILADNLQIQVWKINA